MSVTDLRGTQRWYAEVLGLSPAGGTNTFRGPVLSMVQGLRRVASTCWWLVDAQADFQIELFQFHNPVSRPLMTGRQPRDIGYAMVSVHVADLDATLARAAAAGTPALTDPLGDAGGRRVCLRDPEGVLVELMEDDPREGLGRRRPRPQVPAAVRGVRLSVPDLSRSRRFLCDTLGLQPAEPGLLHRPEHEHLWGAGGAQPEQLLLWAGDVLVEIVEYSDPAGAPWPQDHRISDQGLLNIAFTFAGVRAWSRACRRIAAAGYRFNGRPINFLLGGLAYLNDDQGFSFELLVLRSWLGRRYGFSARPTPRFAPFLRSAP